MKIIFPLLINFIFIGFLNSQPNFGGICNDKNGNIYCGGYFTNTIDLGDKNIFKSGVSNDVFVSKYTSEGNCIWASHFGVEHNVTLSAISSDQNGNTYFTGSFDTSAHFRDLKMIAPSAKIYASPNFYLVKLNVSGDPVWIKSSKNKGRDDGSAIALDPSGNIFIAGTFDNTFELDGRTISAKGNTDIFVMKLKSDGTILWLKNIGDEKENICNTIHYSGSKLYIGFNSAADSKYIGHLLCLQEVNGEQVWDKDIGSNKGSVDAICTGQENSILISGSIESRNNNENKELLIAKYTADGTNVWTKLFTGGFPNGSGIETDSKGNIYVTGDFIDSLRLGKFNTGGYPKEDLFLAKFNPNGIPLSLVSAGNSKIDKGSHLHLFNNSLFLGGTFTNGLSFGKLNIKGSDNTLFMARFEPIKMNCEKMSVLASESTYGEEIKSTNIYGKLLIGKGNDKNFLTDQALYIENQKGEILKRTVSDEKGDFSFRNIDSETGFNLVLESNEKLKETDEIFLATQTGFIMDKINMKDKKFVYPIIPAIISKLSELEEDDVALKFTEFGNNGGKEFMITERISYEPNSWTIPLESIPYLNKIISYMKKYSRTKLEINSHTDALGDEDFNQNLSKIRGEEVKDYLVKNKISSTRIFVKGHGEDNILNRCINGIKCSESEHSFNRRIEFRFYLSTGL